MTGRVRFIVAATFLVVILVLAMSMYSTEIRTPIVLTLNGKPVHVADTWQEWFITYKDRSPRSLKNEFKIPVGFQLPETAGQFSYTKVEIKVQSLGNLGVQYLLVLDGEADVWIGEERADLYLGRVVLTYDVIPGQDASVTEISFYVGDAAGANQLKASIGWGEQLWDGLRASLFKATPASGCILNIQGAIDRLGAVGSWYLWVKAKIHARLMTAPTGPGYAPQLVDEKWSQPFDLQAPFELGRAQTYTPPFTVTVSPETTTSGKPQVVVVVPRYTVTRASTVYTWQRTTITIAPTTYTHTEDSITLTGQEPFDFCKAYPDNWFCKLNPCSWPLVSWFCGDPFAWLNGTTWGIPNWLILLGVVLVVLWILSKLFAPRVQVGG